MHGKCKIKQNNHSKGFTLVRGKIRFLFICFNDSFVSDLIKRCKLVLCKILSCKV